MHPPLSSNLHTPKCQEIIKQLEDCHNHFHWKKFFGACNDLKRALDKCLTEEYLDRKKTNQEIAKAKKRRWKEICEEK